ncbi:MAG: hypothetical protein HUU02_17000, partial [Bacteroidetes bacterium]|nr:hypothetical protein [Bacteroidota bacterium]
MHAQLQGELHSRQSRKGNIEVAVFNNGILFGDHRQMITSAPFQYGFAPYLLNYPKSNTQISVHGFYHGIGIFARKDKKKLFSDAGYLRTTFLEPHEIAHGPFSQMVPGYIGDPKAGYDPVYKGYGWRYNDDPDFIVYSSLDYNEKGVDISGANYNDWPIRNIHNTGKYVASPLERREYPPKYVSDEDMFAVFKDTDIRADERYTGVGGKSEPICVEVHHYMHFWDLGVFNNIMIYRYEIINKSGVSLDSVYFIFSPNLDYNPWNRIFAGFPQDQLIKMINLPYVKNGMTSFIHTELTTPHNWRGFYKESPFSIISYKHISSSSTLSSHVPYFWRRPSSSSLHDSTGNYYLPDSLLYDSVTTYFPNAPDSAGTFGAFIAGPFNLRPLDTARSSYAISFSDDLKKLVLMNEAIAAMHLNNYQRPSPPPTATLTGKGLNNAVRLQWNSVSEQATDIIVPD